MNFKVINQTQMKILCYGSGQLPKPYYKDFKYLNFNLDLLNYNSNNIFVLAIDKHKVVGIVKIMPQENENWLSYITVHPNSRRKGIAIQLLTYVFETFKNKPLLLSNYTEQGLIYLKPFIDKHKEIYPNLYFN